MLETRSYQAEQLDQLDLSGEPLNQTLRGLSVINRLLGNQRATIRALDGWWKSMPHPPQQLHIVDLGCGRGDSLRAIATWMRKRGIEGRLTGIEGNPHTIDLARSESRAFGEIDYLKADILSPNYLPEPCDVLYSSHFIYHFPDEQLVRFLQQARSRVRYTMLFSELQRHWLPYSLFRTLSALLPFSRMVKEDGLTAISRSLTAAEWRDVLAQAGFGTVSIRKAFAFRYQITVPTSRPGV